MASVGSDDTSDTAHVLHGVFEKHQVHHGVGVIVLTKCITQALRQLVNGGELIVLFLFKAFHELGKDERL